MAEPRRTKKYEKRLKSVTIRVTEQLVEITNLQTPASERSTYAVVLPKRKAGLQVDMSEPVKDILLGRGPLNLNQNPDILNEIVVQIKSNVLKEIP